MNMISSFILVVAEIALITFLNYKVAGTYLSLDVLYCLPVIQAASLATIRSLRSSDTQITTIIGVVSAITWSVAEAAVVWPTFPLSAFALNIFTRSITLTVLGRVVAKLWKEREFSRKDLLTGLANRMVFAERFNTEQLRSARSGNPYSILFINIDQFKKMNDQLGRSIGDTALKVVSGILNSNSRSIDTVARIGGDEFVVLFPETDQYICSILVKRIMSVAEMEFAAEGWPISISVGQVTAGGNDKSLEELLHEADRHMYSLRSNK